MQDNGEGADDGEDIPFLEAFKSVELYEAAVASCARDHDHVLIKPLLYQNCHQCCTEAEGKAREPEGTSVSSHLYGSVGAWLLP